MASENTTETRNLTAPEQGVMHRALRRSLRKCKACGQLATRQDAEGVWLCEGDYQHSLEHWRPEGFGVQYGQ